MISQLHDDAGAVLKRAADGSIDLIFLDSERPEYPGWWPDLRRVLRPGGLLVVDNAISHPEQMAPFVALYRAPTAGQVPIAFSPSAMSTVISFVSGSNACRNSSFGTASGTTRRGPQGRTPAREAVILKTGGWTGSPGPC